MQVNTSQYQVTGACCSTGGAYCAGADGLDVTLPRTTALTKAHETSRYAWFGLNTKGTIADIIALISSSSTLVYVAVLAASRAAAPRVSCFPGILHWRHWRSTLAPFHSRILGQDESITMHGLRTLQRTHIKRQLAVASLPAAKEPAFLPIFLPAVGHLQWLKVGRALAFLGKQNPRLNNNTRWVAALMETAIRSARR